MQQENINIFYTDDDEDDRDFFKVAVNEISHSLQIITLGDGDKLIDLLNNPPPTPHIIFLDLNMPRKNGYEVLKELKLIKSNKGIPVIILSTSNDEISIGTTRQLGAKMYITKPSSINLLKKAIKHILSINWETFDSYSEDFVYKSD